MDEQDPILRYANISNMTWQIINQLVIQDANHVHRERLLLWKAYLKSIKPVPDEILTNAVESFQQALVWANLELTDANEAQLVMDLLGDLCWVAINETGRREWL